MSNHTLLEFNHDYCPKLEDAQKWAEGIIIHMRTGDISSLPQGVKFRHMRHHSEPDPLVKKARREEAG